MEEVNITSEPQLIKPGLKTNLTCIVNRVRPEPSDMYWTLNGQRYNGTISSSLNEDGVTLSSINTIQFRCVSNFGQDLKKDNVFQSLHFKFLFLFSFLNTEKRVQCTVVPVYGDSVTIQKEVGWPNDETCKTFCV